MIEAQLKFLFLLPALLFLSGIPAVVAGGNERPVKSGIEAPLEYPQSSTPRNYGPTLPLIAEFDIGGCSDAALSGNTLCVIGRKGLFIYDVSVPESPRLTGQLGGLGSCRQIEVWKQTAFITSREDGLFIVDIGNPNAPKLLSHYDTLELATGIAVNGNIAAVANRHYGVEFIDVSDPAQPKYLSQVSTGEAQSVYLAGDYAYVGVWGTREMVICNIRNPRAPIITGKVALDGFGDGVWVAGRYAYAATGHHAAKLRKAVSSDPAFGKGHGLEVIDLAGSGKAKVISITKLPEFYSRYVDMWDVCVSGKYAWVGDTFAGVFAMDISNPSKPVYAGRIILPSMGKGMERIPVGGFAVGRGVVYVAGLRKGFFVAAAPGMALPPQARGEHPIIIPLATEEKSPSIYRTGTQIHSVAVTPDGTAAVVAAGRGGVHLVELKRGLPGKKIIDTDDVAFDVAFSGDRLYVAEGRNGLSVWQYRNHKPPVLLGRKKFYKGGVYQLLPQPQGQYVLLHVGINLLYIIDAASPANMKEVMTDIHTGLMYRLPLTSAFLDNRYAFSMWHRSGYFGYDLQNGAKPVRLDYHVSEAVNPATGCAFLNDKLLVVDRDGYYLRPFLNQAGADPKATQLIRTGGVDITGKPTVSGNRLYTASRWGRTVNALDISNPLQPKVLWTVKTAGNPGVLRTSGNLLLIPAGNEGLSVLNVEDGTPFWK